MRAKVVQEQEEEVLQGPQGGETLASYVIGKNLAWQTHHESNYYKKWDEYYRIWRGIWDPADKISEVERSRIITPATQQAVESSVCEIEEATFGQGKYFDIRDDNLELTQDQAPQPPQAPQAPMPQGAMPQPPAPQKPKGEIAYLQRQLDEDFRKNKIRAACSEVLINAAVWGTGIAEVLVTEEKELKPSSEPIMDGQLTAFGVLSSKKMAVKMKPVLIKNFRIDPAATSIEGAHGVIIEEYVPAHTVYKLQASGVYKKGKVGSVGTQEQDLLADPNLTTDPQDGQIKLLKYFGLVPKHLLDKAKAPEATGEPEDSLDKALGTEETPEEDENDLVEAIVVLGNDDFVLKAEANPFMMEDRPIVAFQWDVVPGVFFGRGVVEKGYNSQKALDAEIRARIDALALTAHPMIAMDATKIPRGMTPKIIPGKTLLTNGSPSDVLMPFNLGNVSQITFAQAAELQKMVQQSTGAVDSSGVSGMVNGEATAAGISMSLGAIIKRQKRTLVNFQECFWIPFVQKAAWRYMQFSPETYPVKDYNFVATSTLGIMAREYQVSQLVQLLQTMSPESPMYPKLVESIVDNMNITNREELLEVLRQASQPNPQKEQMVQQAHQAEMATKKAVVDFTNAQAQESTARAAKYAAEAQAVPQETEIKKLDALTKNLQQGAGEDVEFTRRLKIADLALKEKGLGLQKRKIDLDAKRAEEDRAASQELNSYLGK